VNQHRPDPRSRVASLSVALVLAVAALAGCGGHDTTADRTAPSTRSASEAANAPVDPCSLVSTATWKRVLSPADQKTARLERMLDDTGHFAECSVDTGRFPLDDTLTWGYSLGDWSLARAFKQHQELMADPVAARFTGLGVEIDGWEQDDVGAGVFGETAGQVVFASTNYGSGWKPAKNTVLQQQIQPAAAIMLDLEHHSVSGMNKFGIDLPASCPKPSSRRVTRAVGTVAYARGFDQYGNIECDYYSTARRRRLSLSATNRTRLYYRVDHHAARAGFGELASDDPTLTCGPGCDAQVTLVGYHDSASFDIPRKSAYISAGVEADDLDASIPWRTVRPLAVAWRDTWVPKVASSRRLH